MNNRLRELRKKQGLTLDQVAIEAGTSNQMVGMLERGERQLTQKWMERLAPVFRVSPPELISMKTTGRPIRIEGEVQAGKWRAAAVMDGEPEYIDIPVPEVRSGPNLYALRVVGPSMNMIYPEGTILICCHLIEINEEPIHGNKYIFEDLDAADGIETTVKELVIDNDGKRWAWPRSFHPDYQAPVALDVGRPGHTIQAKAKVVYSLKRE